MPLADKFLTLVIDQGTSATKVFLFNSANHMVFKAHEKHTLKNPKPGHVEGDALAIAHSCLKLIHEAIAFAKYKNIIISSAGIAFRSPSDP